MSRSILTACRGTGLLAVGAAAAFLAAPLAAEAASATVSATKMLTTLRQPVTDFALREQSASPQIKTTLLQLRQALGPNPKFSVGYTTALDLPLEALAGTRIPRACPPPSCSRSTPGAPSSCGSTSRARGSRISTGRRWC
ncbi:MAG: hypothetical protein IRY94_05755 [Rhodospirillaceae bacterium]|nr:hypothetical protein [Rhodospirillaceae bacterium]